jgi:hypothetical protein
MIRPLLFAVGLLVVGLLYHHNGANDWLAPSTVPADLTQQQLANELTANVLIAASVVIVALMPRNNKEQQ